MASSTYLQDMACGDIGAQHVLRQLPRPRVDQPVRQRGTALEVMHDITAIHVPKPYRQHQHHQLSSSRSSPKSSASTNDHTNRRLLRQHVEDAGQHVPFSRFPVRAHDRPGRVGQAPGSARRRPRSVRLLEETACHRVSNLQRKPPARCGNTHHFTTGLTRNGLLTRPVSYLRDAEAALAH